MSPTPLHSILFCSLLQAIGPIGGLFGGSIAGPVSDHFGRSAALVLMSVPHLIGWLTQTYAPLMPTFDSFVSVLMIGRWFTGFGTGWGSLVITVSAYYITLHLIKRSCVCEYHLLVWNHHR